MKHLIGFILIVFLSSSTKIRTEPSNFALNEISKTISHSFKIGNSEMLGSCLDKEIELIIDGDKIEFENLPAHQAKSILGSFFRKNPPLSFSYVYQGNSNSALKYCIGNYKSKNSDYLVYLLIKKGRNDKFLINTLQLKRE